MKFLSAVTVINFGLFLGPASNAQAQDPRYRGGYYDDGYYSRRGDYRDSDRYTDYRYSTRRSGSLIRQVMSDIDRAASGAWLDDHELKHINEAARKLQEFEDRWARGDFDTGKLDKAIENIQHLADADRVRPRDRDILSRDLSELRRFRSSRGRYENGGYGYSGDYRNNRW